MEDEQARGLVWEAKRGPALRPGMAFLRVILVVSTCRLLSLLPGFGNVSTVSDIKRVQAYHEKV